MKSKEKPIVLIVVGALLMLGPLWGMIGTVLSMLRTFTTLQQSGAADSEQLAAGIGASLWATVAGIIAAPFGIALLIAGIVWLVKMKQEANRSEPAVGTYGSKTRRSSTATLPGTRGGAIDSLGLGGRRLRFAGRFAWLVRPPPVWLTERV